MKFGLAGTGHWARVAHAAALTSTQGVELGAVWGRNPAATRALAAAHNAKSHDDFDAFLADVDAVAFAVPPDVQAPLALRAARQGKHLLLEKPMTLDEGEANDLVEAVEKAQVASVVFFTARFQPPVRDWISAVKAERGWLGGSAFWLGTGLRATSPFNTPWRHRKGALWDVVPHLVSVLWAGLGPVTAVTADRGGADIVHLVLHHASDPHSGNGGDQRTGVTSTVTATLSAPWDASMAEVALWGASGRTAAPALTPVKGLPALRIALTELAGGQPGHMCDVRFGRDVSAILASAERQLAGR